MQKKIEFEKSSVNFQISYKDELNPSQLEAVTCTKGSLLIIAGAGSGKTRTLVYRVARLIEEGVPPASILLLTFTRKASQEMLKRASLLLDGRCGKVSGGTFHSFANIVLRKYAPQVGYSEGYSIIDRADSESLIGMIRKEISKISGDRSFPRKSTLANIFGKAVNKGICIEEAVEDYYNHLIIFLNEIETIYEKYKIEKIRHKFFDYDDLLVYLLRILKEFPDIRKKISEKYSHIMVDEFQDTNKVQAEIIYFLSAKNRNIMVVGDDSQSIYSFRGANFENIMTFPNLFPGTKIIKLEENYRSIQPILNLTNIMISMSENRYPKNLFTKIKGGSKPLLVEADCENSQSLFIVDEIKKLKKAGIPLNEIAVLFRAGFHSFDLELELNGEGFPFIKVGGFRFAESAHIKDLIALIRVLSNHTDKISWFRILLLMDRIGQKTADRLYKKIVEEKSAYEGLTALKSSKKFSKVWKQDLERLWNLFSYFNSNPLMSVTQTGEAALEYYLPLLQSNYDNHPKRLKDLEQLLMIMERFKSINQFLSDMTLEPPNTSFNDSFSMEETDNNRLILSTIHSAKGLEWHTVFVIWTLNGRFPSVQSLRQPENLEEELRLMYVAATRAKKRLFFIYPRNIYDKISGTFLNRPSCFLEDIQGNALDKCFASR